MFDSPKAAHFRTEPPTALDFRWKVAALVESSGIDDMQIVRIDSPRYRQAARRKLGSILRALELKHEVKFVDF